MSVSRGRLHPLTQFLRRLSGLRSSLHEAFQQGIQLPKKSYPSLHHRYSHDIANVVVLRVFGVHATNGVVHWRKRRAITVVLIAFVPLAVAFALPVPPSVSGGLLLTHYFWVAYFCALGIAVAAFAWGGVLVFHRLTPDLEEMLTSRGRRAYDRWADIATAPIPQVAFAMIFALSAMLALRLASMAIGDSSNLYLSPASYMAVGFSSLLISSGGYWIIAGTILSGVLGRAAHIRLFWLSPATTPGLELLARCYRLAFYGASVGVALCLFPILNWAYGIQNSTMLEIVKGGLFVVSVVVVLAVAIIPQWQLSSVVADTRRNTLKDLQAQLPAAIDRNSDQAQGAANLIGVAAASASTTVKESTVAGVLLGLATALLPYILKLLS